MNLLQDHSVGLSRAFAVSAGFVCGQHVDVQEEEYERFLSINTLTIMDATSGDVLEQTHFPLFESHFTLRAMAVVTDDLVVYMVDQHDLGVLSATGWRAKIDLSLDPSQGRMLLQLDFAAESILVGEQTGICIEYCINSQLTKPFYKELNNLKNVKFREICQDSGG